MSTLTVDEMREAIRQAPRYRGSPNWQLKVKNMSDRQVIAIYIRFRGAGII